MTSQRHPFYEHVLKEENETFLWRCDDYPWIRNVWNVHPECEIHLIRNATGVALIGDYVGHFEPGFLTVVGGGLPHDWVTTVRPGEIIEGRDIVLQFAPDRLQRIVASLPELIQLKPFLSLASRGLSFVGNTRRVAAQLLEQIGQTNGLDRLSLFFKLLHLLTTTEEFEFLSSEGFVAQLDPQTLEKLQPVLTYLVENFQSDTTLSHAAKMVGMSGSAFSRFFQKNTGNSFSDHIKKLRISRACQLLIETELPVTEVCFGSGYLNVSNFNRAFRVQRGITPSTYRRLARRQIV